ncbi:GNAT family N-acetyltransferase [Deinococcus altitudinis]|uniref:GNAT family N-acetyltransferase n=1 Tax=Deinococcus altitudinis TaxID=468914 RepID=UPI003892A18B
MTLPSGRTLPSGYVLRPATVADADTITAQREAMFSEMGVGNAEAIANFRPWVEARLASEHYLAWLIEHGGEVVAGAGLMLLDWPPHFSDPNPLRGYLLNVYVGPQHRGRGLARTLTQAAMSESARRGIRVLSLHASKFGRPLYEGLGFVPTNEMWLKSGGPA